MRSRVLFGFILLTSTVLLLFSQEQEPLGTAARRLRSEKTNSQQQADPALPQRPKLSEYAPPDGPYLTPDAPDSGNPLDSTNPIVYQEAVRKLLLADNFDELDRIGRRDRSTKSRFPGGSWKLYTYYPAISGRNNDATPEPEALADIEHLKRWVAAKPDSITARIGLAGAYSAYA